MKKKIMSMILAAVLALTPSFSALAMPQEDDYLPVEASEMPEVVPFDVEDAGESKIKTAVSGERKSFGDFEYSVEDGTVTITKYTGTSEVVTVPAQMDGMDVVAVGDNTFEENKIIKEVILSDGIKRMGNAVFYHCTALEHVTFPNTLEWIGRWGFDECNALTSLRIDQTSDLEVDGYAFAGAPNLKTIELIGENTVFVGGSFYGCNGLETVAFGTKVRAKDGGDANLSHCPKLKTILVSASNPYYTVKENVLYNQEMTRILCYPAAMPGTEYTIPNTVTEIPSYIFSNNKYLQKIVCGSGVTKIGNYVGLDNYSISIVEIPPTVTTIGDSCFVDATIWGKRGSTAEKYANKYKMTFVDADDLEFLDGKESTSGSDCSDWNGTKTEAITPIGNTYVVKTAAQLAWLALETKNGNNFAGKKVLLDADIDLNGKEWTPIGNSATYFRGSFDGQGHTIYNLKVTGSSNQSLCGLFGGIASGIAGVNVVIENLTLKDVEITNASYGGGLAGYARIYKGTNLVIENCAVEGSFTGNTVGGLIGRMAGGLSSSGIVVQSINNECSVSASGSGGGVIGIIEQYGYNYSVLGNGVGTVDIIECSNKGNVLGNQNYAVVGGIIGSASNTARGILNIEHCMTEGEVKAFSSVNLGGIISELYGAQNSIKQCVNYANIKGGYYTGGIVGELGSGTDNAENAIVLEQCYNEGKIEVTSIGCVLGGITGRNGGLIRNCYNTGAIGGGTVVYNGGITGFNAGFLENCYNIGNLPIRAAGATNVSLPGEMANLLGGHTSYCFFDKTQDEDGYLYGRMDTQEIITDTEDNIKYSGGMTTAEMKTPAAYVVWDFENIWEIDREYGYGYPILSEIKDILKKHPDESESSMVYEKDEFRFTVVDQNGEKLEGVIIKCGDATMETNKDGVAVFDYEKDRMKLSVSKENYFTYSDDTYEMNETLENTIRLVSEDDIYKYALNSAVMYWHGHRYELLTQAKEVNKKYQDEIITLVCKALADASEVEIYELYQGDTLIEESEDGVFTLTPKDLMETKTNGKVRNTYVKVYLKNNVVCEEEINLIVVDEDNQVSEVEFGQDLKFTVGDDVPLLGGMTINFDTMKLPINVSVSEEKWKVTLNIMEKEMGEAAELFKSELTATKKLEKLKKYMDTGVIETSKNPNVTLEIAGYGEGDMPIDGNKINMTAYVQLAMKYGKEVQVYPGIVFAVEFEGKIKLDGEIEWDIAEVKLDGNLKLGGSAALSAYLGVGVANIASAGAYGTGTFHIVFYLLPISKAGLDEMYLEADLKAVIRFLGSNALEYPIAGPWYGWIYSRELEEYSMQSLNAASRKETVENFLLSLNDSVVTANEERAKSVFSGNNGLIVDQAYSESKPVLMECQGDVLMLFTDNSLEERKAEDASVLMFSLYDSQTGVWGEPSPVWEDGTADFNPVVADNMVVWSNAKKSLSECKTYADLGAAQEVAFAVYNSETKSFERAENITDNDVYENNVNIHSVQGTPVAAWTVNSDGNVFGVGGTNDIYMASSDTWEAKKVAAVNGVVLMVQPGYYNGKITCVYVADENEALTDGIGQFAYTVDMDTETVEKVSDTEVSYVWITNTSQIMCVGADGKIITYHSKTDSEGSEPDLEEDVLDDVVDVKGSDDEAQMGILYGTITDILEDESGNITVFYVVGEDNSSNGYRMFYDAATEKWSNPVAVTQQDDYVEHVAGAFLDNEILVAYNQRTFDMQSENLDGTNALHWDQIESGKALFTELEVYFNPWNVAPGEELPLMLSVKNTGTAACHKVDVLIKHGETIYLEETLNNEILPGEEKEFLLRFTLPDNAVKTEYTLELKGDVDTVSETFTVGESYYHIEKNHYCIDGRHMVVASVRNMGFENGSGTLEVFDNTDTGAVYETFDFNGLEYGEVLYYSTYIENMDWESFEVAAVGLRVKKGEQEASDVRTITIFQEKEVKVTGVSIEQTHIYLEGKGYEAPLTAAVNPSSVKDVNLIWESSDKSVAVVDENGRVIAVGPGQAVIKVSTEDGSYYGRCLVEVGGTVNPDNPNPDVPGGVNFVDIEKDAFYYEPVLWAVEKDITKGVTATQFQPYAGCTRGQIATFIWRAEGSPVASNKNCTFTDVDAGQFYYEPMLWGVENGVITGYSDKIFAPDDICTRGQIVTMIWRAKGKPIASNQDHPFIDVSKEYYYDAMLWAVEKGITKGTSPTAFEPNKNVNRGETVTFLFRAYK